MPPAAVERFAGVGNPFRFVRLRKGLRVLDVGCGCGMDVFLAALHVGGTGRAVGLDLTKEMLAVARRAARRRIGGPVEFRCGSAERLPFPDGSFDVVLSNGALNLVPDKDAAFREVRRVLRPGGTLAAADLLVTSSIPKRTLASMDAWST